ncbi:hypothetical protein [Paraglaciecola marina]|uniref:hypothetical protein n=1 Tax=Paraglaciecola marina TaxID=2500157 RepID=UPI00105C7686|nr:hypothetical protein [Paraglaciecola marina]
MERHTLTFRLPIDSTVHQIIEHLTLKKYLVPVAGFNHSWQVFIGDKIITSFKGNNVEPEKSPSLDNSVSSYLDNGRVNVYIRYQSAET